MKLSKTQQAVVDKLKDGWEISYWTGYDISAAIFNPNKDGTWTNIRTNTFHVLLDRKIIKFAEKISAFANRYVLNEEER